MLSVSPLLTRGLVHYYFPNWMNRRPNISYQKPNRTTVNVRRPFWLPASNYYVLAAAAAIAFFFLAWGVLHEVAQETPWVTAGVGASIILAGAVVLRAAIMRRAHERYSQIEPTLAQKYSPQLRDRRRKLTLEQNAAILGEIKQKSDAANVLSKFSAGHREVFDLCSEYIERTDSELATIGAGSPRFSAVLKGRKTASGVHRRHMLQWAEIEAKRLTGEANKSLETDARINSVKEAARVIEFALGVYPSEKSLIESRDILREMAVSIRVSELAEKAERAAFKGDLRDAISLYRDALFYLGHDNIQTVDRRQVADHINAEIDRLRLLENRE